MAETARDFEIPRLGGGRLPNPLRAARFVRDDERVLFHASPADVRRYFERGEEPPSFERAGPRERIFFDPVGLRCGVVTCGGICPGLNDVIRAIVLSLYHHYGVRTVYGFRYGYEGLNPQYGHEPVLLTPDVVRDIGELGGTILGTSRGPQDPAVMTDHLEALGVRILFAIGGDGTLRGAAAIAAEVARRGREIAVVGVPKTIDNDISYVQTSFGFSTAVSEARRVVAGAHSEAEGARNGVALVKLMGRESGFIAAHSAIADSQVNFCLVPEVPFRLEDFLSALDERLERRSHAVIVVAEGAGQHLIPGEPERDASGNVVLRDVGIFLREQIRAHFARRGIRASLKYIDPSYVIRSVPANAWDSAFCLLLGHNAVHAGMAGRTGVVVGNWGQEFTHVPIRLAISRRKRIDPESWLWSAVLASTGQPKFDGGAA